MGHAGTCLSNRAKAGDEPSVTRTVDKVGPQHDSPGVANSQLGPQPRGTRGRAGHRLQLAFFDASVGAGAVHGGRADVHDALDTSLLSLFQKRLSPGVVDVMTLLGVAAHVAGCVHEHVRS